MFGGLDGLAIDNASTGLPVFPGRHPHVAAEPVVPQLPGPVLLPASNIMIDDLPGGEVMGEQAPRTATSQNIHDTVQDVACGRLLWSAPRLGSGHIRGNQRPFLVSEVSRIGFSGFNAPDGNPAYWATANFLNTLLLEGLEENNAWHLWRPGM